MARKLELITDAPRSDAEGMPPDLGPEAQAFWRSCMREYRIVDPAGISLLQGCCLAIHRAQRCRILIDRDGEIVQTKHGPKDHPLLKIEALNLSLAARLIRALGLDVEPIRSVGRPPVYGGA
jgi:hypothetical protein